MAGRRASLLTPIAMAAAVLTAIMMPGEPMRVSVDEPRPERPARPEPARTTELRSIALPPAADAPPADPRPPVPAPPPPPTVRPSAADVGLGRLLLDRIEKGEGPVIEIAWPDHPGERRRLAEHLGRCAGWRTLLLADGRLWRAEDPAGRPWSPVPDRAPSGYLRDLEGPAADPGAMAAIRARHGLAVGRPVAAVDRRWDARLLGGLGRLLGVGWSGRGEIRARYLVGADRLTVAEVSLDGRPVPGLVDLGPLSRCDR